MNPEPSIRRPLLARGARYRWDTVRRQHQVVFPEGVLVLNESAAAIAQLLDGRSTDDVVRQLETKSEGSNVEGDVHEFMARLAARGLLRDADDA